MIKQSLRRSCASFARKLRFIESAGEPNFALGLSVLEGFLLPAVEHGRGVPYGSQESETRGAFEKHPSLPHLMPADSRFFWRSFAGPGAVGVRQPA